MAHPLHERKKSRHEIRAAAEALIATCGHESAVITRRVRKARVGLDARSVVTCVLIVAAIFGLGCALAGCAFTPEGLESAGHAMQDIGGAVKDVAAYTPIGGLGGLVEALGGAVVLAGGFWRVLRKKPEPPK